MAASLKQKEMGLQNLPEILPDTIPCLTEDCVLVKGKIVYFHYLCDGHDDRGWGCGYRTLQSLCFWVKHELMIVVKAACTVPTIPQIQTALVTMEDKPESFKKSREWIGSFEVCLCLDYFYDIPCKIVHVRSGKDLVNHVDEVIQHFQEFGSPVMMGGESDCSSKCVLGVCKHPPAFYIMDPHYSGPIKEIQTLQEDGWLKWRQLEEFKDHTFYNLCLPKHKSTAIT